MRNTAILFLLLLPSVSAVAQSDSDILRPVRWPSGRSRVVVQTDEFTGETDRRLEIMRMRDPQNLIIRKTRGSSHWHFLSATESWEYLRCHSVAILADRHRVRVRNVQHNGTVSRYGGVIESIAWDISEADLRRMASAQEVKIRICMDVYVLPSDFPRHVRELLGLSPREDSNSSVQTQTSDID